MTLEVCDATGFLVGPGGHYMGDSRGHEDKIANHHAIQDTTRRQCDVKNLTNCLEAIDQGATVRLPADLYEVVNAAVRGELGAASKNGVELSLTTLFRAKVVETIEAVEAGRDVRAVAAPRSGVVIAWNPALKRGLG